MRRIDLWNALPAIPSNAYIECFKRARDGGNSGPQHVLASAFGTAAAATAVDAKADLIIAGNAGTIIATVDGLSTGLILESETAIDITSSVATKLVTLPDVQPHGKIFHLFCIANGCDVVSANAADKLNNVIIGATNGAPLTAAVWYTLRYDGINGNWICTGLTNLGVVETPIVPVAL